MQKFYTLTDIEEYNSFKWNEERLPKEYREHEIFTNLESINDLYDFLLSMVDREFKWYNYNGELISHHIFDKPLLDELFYFCDILNIRFGHF